MSAAAEPAQRWATLEQMLEEGVPPGAAEELVRLYRATCDDLALARQRKLDLATIDRLNALVTAGHQLLYRTERGSWRRVIDLMTRDFPRAVRTEKALVLAAHLLFYTPAAGIALWLWRDPDMIYSLLDPPTARLLEEMYDPQGAHYLRERTFDSDTQMFGFYIWNNVAIGFKTFASGVLAGVGSLFILLGNGLFLGAVAAHLGHAGLADELMTFVIGHGSLELTAIVLTGVAGMRLGWAVIAPGNISRGAALTVAARRAVPIVYGATAMLLGAAAVEAFWSASRVLPPEVKLMAGSAGWALLALYLMFAGRVRGPRAH